MVLDEGAEVMVAEEAVVAVVAVVVVVALEALLWVLASVPVSPW